LHFFGESIRHLGFTIYAKNLNKNIDCVMKELESQYIQVAPSDYEEKAKKLLEHVYQSVPYYKSYLGCALTELPVITKELLRAEYSNFISTKYSPERLIKTETSGSYGAPMCHLLTKEKKQRRAIEAIYYNTWAKYSVGMKHILNSAGISKSRLLRFIQNEIVCDISDKRSGGVKLACDILRAGQVSFYTGYASALNDLVDYCYEHGINFDGYNLKGIIAIGEALPTETRIKAKKLFDCPVLSRYATLEFGVLAHECPEEEKHHLNNASYHIELLSPDTGKPVSHGETGKVVVTD
jgi:phenylacetate-CoA ligase